MRRHSFRFAVVSLGLFGSVTAYAGVRSTQAKLNRLFESGRAFELLEQFSSVGWKCTTYPLALSRGNRFVRTTNRDLAELFAETIQPQDCRLFEYGAETFLVTRQSRSTTRRAREIIAYSLCAQKPSSPILTRDGYSDAAVEPLEFEFPEDTIEGERQGPDGMLISVPPRPKFESLIIIRDNFRREVMDSVSGL